MIPVTARYIRSHRDEFRDRLSILLRSSSSTSSSTSSSSPPPPLPPPTIASDARGDGGCRLSTVLKPDHLLGWTSLTRSTRPGSVSVSLSLRLSLLSPHHYSGPHLASSSLPLWSSVPIVAFVSDPASTILTAEVSSIPSLLLLFHLTLTLGTTTAT